MSVDIERTQHGQRLTETNLQIELQNYKHQVSLKEQTVSTISQERDKVLVGVTWAFFSCRRLFNLSQ